MTNGVLSATRPANMNAGHGVKYHIHSAYSASFGQFFFVCFVVLVLYVNIS